MLLVRRGCVEGKSPTTVFGRKTTCHTCRNGKILRFCSGQLTLGIKIKRMPPLNLVAGRRSPLHGEAPCSAPPQHPAQGKPLYYWQSAEYAHLLPLRKSGGHPCNYRRLIFLTVYCRLNANIGTVTLTFINWITRHS